MIFIGLEAICFNNYFALTLFVKLALWGGYLLFKISRHNFVVPVRMWS